MTATLFYVHDPMCSWCWGFRPTLAQLRSRLPDSIHFSQLVGGLAPDSWEPMPKAMQQSLQTTWQHIAHKIPGTLFNFDFWSACQPRRSTYPACRAVLAARACEAGADERMTFAIQQAYYLRAMNPSDNDVLIQLAGELGLDQKAFAQHLRSEAIEVQLHDEIMRARGLGADSFPSLILKFEDKGNCPVAIDYTEAQNMIESIQALIESNAQ